MTEETYDLVVEHTFNKGKIVNNNKGGESDVVLDWGLDLIRSRSDEVVLYVDNPTNIKGDLHNLASVIKHYAMQFTLHLSHVKGVVRKNIFSIALQYHSGMNRLEVSINTFDNNGQFGFVNFFYFEMLDDKNEFVRILSKT